MKTPPIFVMVEHPTKTAELQAILAQSLCAGLLIDTSYVDFAAGKFAATIALVRLAHAAGKRAYLKASPLPMLGGSPSITLDGDALPLAWEASYLVDCALGWKLMAGQIEAAGLTNTIAGVRCCFSTGADGDAEQGFRLAPAANSSGPQIYMQSWLDAGWTQEAYLAAMRQHASDLAMAWPGKDISLSLLDPLSNRMGPSSNVLPHRDHGALSRLLNAACAAGLSGSSGCTFTAFFTNFRVKIANAAYPATSDSIMLYVQDVAVNGRLGLQLDDIGTTDADFVALIDAAMPYGPDRIEIHQRQATPGVFSALAADQAAELAPA